jgi:hypothetical protein
MDEAVESFRHWMYGALTLLPLGWYQVLFLGPLPQITRLRAAPNALYMYCWVLGTRFLFFHMYCMCNSHRELPDAPGYLAVLCVWGLR